MTLGQEFSGYAEQVANRAPVSRRPCSGWNWRRAALPSAPA